MSARDPSLSFVCEMVALYGPAAFRAEAARLYLIPAVGEEIEARGDDLEVLSLIADWYKSTRLLVQTYFRSFGSPGARHAATAGALAQTSKAEERLKHSSRQVILAVKTDTHS